MKTVKTTPIQTLLFLTILTLLIGCGGGSNDSDPTPENNSDSTPENNSFPEQLQSSIWLSSECLSNGNVNYLKGLYQFTTDSQILFGYQEFQDSSCTTPTEQTQPYLNAGSYIVHNSETLQDGSSGYEIEIIVDTQSHTGYFSTIDEDRFCTSNNLNFSSIGLYIDQSSNSNLNYETCLRAFATVENLPPSDPEEDQDTTDPEENQDNSDIPTAQISPPTPPSGLREIRGVIVMGWQPGGTYGLTEEFIALFNDGTYSDDLKTTFGRSKEYSKQENPNSWGEWRLRQSDSELELKEHDDTTFEDTRGNWVARTATNGEALSGCFGRLTTSGSAYDGDTVVGLAQTWCFWENGRFTNSSTAFGNSSSGIDITMHSVSPKSRGRYYVSGYTINLVYDDGHSIQAAFCFANEDRDHITLNGKRFMGGGE
jgi:hypothetical protein